ncbi:MAG: prolyl oligopeptidase family serine peptidase, partial [Cyclobacteriaceae bacterium]
SDAYIIGLNLGQHYDISLDEMNIVEFYEDRIIWTSERSGTNQLYLYALDGTFIRKLTDRNSNGIVGELRMVADGWAYFDGFEIQVGNTESLVDGKYYRVSLETGQPEIITEGPVIIADLWSTDKNRFWIMHGNLHHVTIEEFNEQGEKVDTFWDYELTQDEAYGYDPEYAWTEAPGSSVLIGSAILKPKDFDPESSYPVVEYIYGAPFSNVMPWMPFDRRSRQFQDLANEGFIVVFTDARGTELRGREYQEYSYGRLGQVEIADHAYVLEKLAETRPYMDMNRVGIIGASMGGYFSLRAMILRPDLYKVGHINSPNIDPEKFRVPLEPYFGCLPDECPEVYAAATVSDRLDQLTGKMLITVGTADQHIPFSEFKRLTEAMDKAGYTDYELDVYEGMHHLVHQDPRWYPRMVEFFKKELISEDGKLSKSGNE